MTKPGRLGRCWLPLFILLATAGCSSSRRAAAPGEPTGSPRGSVTVPPESAAGPHADRTNVPREGYLAADGRYVAIDSLSNTPDISDSLAAVTKSRVQSVDEIFDYPVVVNRRVLSWVDFYLGRGRGSFDRSLARSGRYLAYARRVFAEEGIPQDLVFMAHVESGFRHNARSHAGALGLWQFMRGTARLYDLRCDGYVDERLDPEKSTRAAARHLRDLYEKYGDWYLALAAYNAGAGKVDRAIRRAGTRDFWEIARTRYLRSETRNYVPAILATSILAKSPGAYGLNEETEEPLEYESVPVDSPTDLRIVARCIGVPAEEVTALNPAILQMQTPPNTRDYHVKVPRGTGEILAIELAKIPPDKRLVFHRHKVRRGDTLGALARRYHTSVRSIQNANGMGRRTTIYVGRTLRIPATDLPVEALAGGGDVRHRVRRGESLGRIARRYGVSVAAVQRANGIRNPSRIRAGEVLTIPVPAPVARREPPAVDTSPAAGVVKGGSAPAGTAPRANTADSLGRVPTTTHIVESARRTIKEEEAAAPRDEPAVYVVRRGDTLSEIAERHGVGLSSLRSWNGLGRRSRIYPGQELIVRGGSAPGGGRARVHVVSRGDSLWDIARRYGVRVADLVDWNNLRRSTKIFPGQSLRIF